MKVDNIKLIAEVKKRRPLWDSNIKMSSRKEICVIQWQEVAAILQVDEMVCRKRFKSLRDSYRAEIRKIQCNRLDVSHWPYFHTLEFMRNIFDPHNLVPFPPEDSYPEQYDKLDNVTIEIDTDESFDFDVVGDIFLRDTPEKQVEDNSYSNTSMPLIKICPDKYEVREQVMKSKSLSPVRPESPLSIVKPPAAKRLKQNNVLSDRPEPAVKPSESSGSDAAPAKDDADYNFLVSLLPHMKSLSDMGNLKFRMEISKILIELKQSDSQNVGPQQLQQQQQPQQQISVQSPPVMPKLVRAPPHISRFTEPANYAVATMSNNNHYSDNTPVTLECDVKIENEPL